MGVPENKKRADKCKQSEAENHHREEGVETETETEGNKTKQACEELNETIDTKQWMPPSKRIWEGFCHCIK